jgi:hypothetical protein
MTTREQAILDNLTRKLTAFESFAGLIGAKDYCPTLPNTGEGVRLANAYNVLSPNNRRAQLASRKT